MSHAPFTSRTAPFMRSSRAARNVRQEEGAVLSTYPTQAEAEAAGKDWLRDNGGGEIFTHRATRGALPHPQGRRRLLAPRLGLRPGVCWWDRAQGCSKDAGGPLMTPLEVLLSAVVATMAASTAAKMIPPAITSAATADRYRGRSLLGRSMGPR